uniref:Uncharacterized protein n=1 Tax=Glossina palpalis gambiensis TaxID=67801 RepID=A0A1B0AKF8_9MUSC
MRRSLVGKTAAIVDSTTLHGSCSECRRKDIGFYKLFVQTKMWFAEKKKMLVVVMARFNRCQEAFEECALLNGSKLSLKNCSFPAANVCETCVACGPSTKAPPPVDLLSVDQVNLSSPNPGLQLASSCSRIGNDIAKRDLSKDTMVKNLRISPRGSYPATTIDLSFMTTINLYARCGMHRRREVISRLASDADVDYIRAHILMKIVTLNPNRVYIFKIKATQDSTFQTYQLSILDLSCLNRFEECLSTFIPRGRKAVKNLAIENDNAVPSTTIGLVTDIVLPGNVPVAKN